MSGKQEVTIFSQKEVTSLKKKLWNKGNIHGNKSTEKEHKQ